jgi:ribosome-binding factor A
MARQYGYKRSARLQEVILEEISKLIQAGLKDPRIGFVTVTHVVLSDNLKYAKVYVSVLGTEKQKSETLVGLISAGGHIRSHLGKILHLRKVPELAFIHDDSTEYADRIARLLHQINDQRGD